MVQSFHTPILFIIFNRPDTTARVFQQIRAIKPKQLFVAADGPRLQKIGEKEMCEQTRAILKQVDWGCDVKTRFSETNQGCKVGVSSAITWFFEQVEEGIILEDDCLPDVSFFSYCENLLERYRNDERVMHIGGANFQNNVHRGSGSYYFSQLPHVWGWATWKRAWSLYDVNMKLYPELLASGKMQIMFPHNQLNQYWQYRFDLAYKNQIDTWDIQWQYTLLVHHALSIIPNVNLISNIGFWENATHTKAQFNVLANIPTRSLKEIVHPQEIILDPKADLYSFHKYFSPPKIIKLYYLLINQFRQLLPVTH
ncbi:MAG TPA: nucleotide-diphospho-sugar transferase [Bacteroidota bacterium]|nr:nucleotide-diphospho-sugar transferase [Bacteroidota bacterium]